MAESHPTYNKSLESKERTRVSYLMSKTHEELAEDLKWQAFVQECIDEHGYAWQYNFPKESYKSKKYNGNRREKRTLKK